MKHILYEMDNFLLKEKNSFMTGTNKFLARDGEGRGRGIMGKQILLMFFMFQTIYNSLEGSYFFFITFFYPFPYPVGIKMIHITD